MALVTIVTDEGDMVLSLQVSARGVPPEAAVAEALPGFRVALVEALEAEKSANE